MIEILGARVVFRVTRPSFRFTKRRRRRLCRPFASSIRILICEDDCLGPLAARRLTGPDRPRQR